MKKRYLYSILYGAPGFFVSLIIAFIIFGAAAGFLWIYAYGDNPWPQSTDNILPALFILTFLALWISSISVGFITGKKLEEKLAESKTIINQSGKKMNCSLARERETIELH